MIIQGLNNVSHDAIFWEIFILGAPQLLLLGVIYFQHQLMWADYKKRYRMNGHSKTDRLKEGVE